MDGIELKAQVEPECSNQTHGEEKNNLGENIEASFFLPPSNNIPVIIYRTECTKHDQCKEREVHLTALEE